MLLLTLIAFGAIDWVYIVSEGKLVDTVLVTLSSKPATPNVRLCHAIAGRGRQLETSRTVDLALDSERSNFADTCIIVTCIIVRSTYQLTCLPMV
jgi:hypothetical protein